jgi:hypothetical protein
MTEEPILIDRLIGNKKQGNDANFWKRELEVSPGKIQGKTTQYLTVLKNTVPGKIEVA